MPIDVAAATASDSFGTDDSDSLQELEIHFASMVMYEKKAVCQLRSIFEHSLEIHKDEHEVLGVMKLHGPAYDRLRTCHPLGII